MKILSFQRFQEILELLSKDTHGKDKIVKLQDKVCVKKRNFLLQSLVLFVNRHSNFYNHSFSNTQAKMWRAYLTWMPGTGSDYTNEIMTTPYIHILVYHTPTITQLLQWSR